MTFSLEERANNTNAATGPGQPTARSGIGQAGRLSLRAALLSARNAALSMVVFGQGRRKWERAFSILYLHGVRQRGQHRLVPLFADMREAYPIFDKEVLPWRLTAKELEQMSVDIGAVAPESLHRM